MRRGEGFGLSMMGLLNSLHTILARVIFTRTRSIAYQLSFVHVFQAMRKPSVPPSHITPDVASQHRTPVAKRVSIQQNKRAPQS
jgi:hypothetical protein